MTTDSLASTDVHVSPATRIAGAVEVPGDKSISHRALLVAMLGTRAVDIQGLATGDDVMSTLAAVQQLGATVVRDPEDPTHVTVTGVGMRGLRSAGRTIDAGNAGTLARLLSGILAGQEGTATIVGDASLSGRPMRRVSRPLSKLGALVETSEAGTLPLQITGRTPLQSGTWEMEIPSAQVQSMLLLAGLYADDDTYVVEPARVRDHTERMLRTAGVPIERQGNTVRVSPVESLALPDVVQIPGDPSAAAGLAVAAMVLPGSLLRLPGICANPGRYGFFELAERMGARIATMSRTTIGGEPVVDIEVTPGPLTRAIIDREDVPSMIDELPLLALLAHFCKGQTIIRGASELRHKESDRIGKLVLALRHIGVACEARSDGEGLFVRGSGSRLDGGEMDAAGDHRLAMLGGIAGLISKRGVTVRGADCVSVSYPGFFEVLDQLRA